MQQASNVFPFWKGAVWKPMVSITDQNTSRETKLKFDFSQEEVIATISHPLWQ